MIISLRRLLVQIELLVIDFREHFGYLQVQKEQDTTIWDQRLLVILHSGFEKLTTIPMA